MMIGRKAEMKRTTSMSEFTLDFNFAAGEAVSQTPFKGGLDQPQFSSAAASPRRNSADFVQTAPFLRACSLCKRRLIPGHDIYMYRGDSAFCSVECRQQQMAQDERKDKCSMASKKEATASAAAGSQVSATG